MHKLVKSYVSTVKSDKVGKFLTHSHYIVGETGAKCYTGQSVTFTYHFVNPLDIRYMPVLFNILLYLFRKTFGVILDI